MFGFEPHGADPWRRERLIRVRCDHRQPLSTFVSEKPTFIAWPATNHAGSRPDAKRRSPLPEAKRRVRAFSCRHHGHQALVQSTREGATSSTFEQWALGQWRSTATTTCLLFGWSAGVIFETLGK